MDNREFVIGVVGGMGSYATLEFFARILKKFPAEKEWDRPRVIIDNRCTMPSRVRAILFDEKVDEVTSSIKESIENLIKMGGQETKIVLACNTSHIFLDYIYKTNPELEKYVLNVIEICAKKVREKDVKSVYLIATEGTIESAIYQDVFAKYGIQVVHPNVNEYLVMRDFIEKVKQDLVDDKVKVEFKDYLSSINHSDIILGCTEFSALYYRMECDMMKIDKNIIEPLDITIDYMHELYSAFVQ